MAKPRKTLSRENWLGAALEALEESGIGGVKVLPLARRLGVSRGSFYWHFEDRRDLLLSLLAHWEHWSTDTVIAALSESGASDPRDRLWRLMEMVLEQGLSNHDPAIRAWALYDADAARAVRRVDRKRLRTVTGLFREAGFSPEQAEARARLLAIYLMGDPVVLAREPAARRRKLARLRWRVLVKP
ncbi:MAG: TetR/AcrR family transcriptional regulator [Planctomycetota bacterium]|jgi:AcrR family transcriptional regulator